jgi:guanine deaminase
MTVKAFRSACLDFVADPFYTSESQAVRYIPDALLVLENGKVKDLGDYAQLHAKYAGIEITSHPNHLILPGFIDIHIHFPQTEMIAAYGKQLLEWLEKYAFPTEHRFKDKTHSDSIAPVFVDELLRNGTTTALVLAAVFPESAEALFEECDRRKMRMIIGKVMMDRNAPDFLRDTAQSSYEESKKLIEKWHHHNRALYAVTPRFAPTSTPEQLTYAGKLLAEFPDVYLHTHLSENLAEIAWVKELFPDAQNYLDVYDQFGLVRERSVFAHCIHLSDSELERLAEAKSAIAFCPTSNTFLGSGLFDIERSIAHQVSLGLATDVGGGTSFSMFKTACEAYKIAQLNHQKLSPFQALFLATLGGAKSLGLEDKIGNFAIGKEADFIVIDPRSTPIMSLRNPETMPTTLEELRDVVFSLIIMGDDRAIHSTYLLGELAHRRD